jgi:SAM-dependent methyltransferase
VSWYRSAFGPRYLQLYAHRDGAEAERALDALFDPRDLRGMRVLDLACGAGRYLVALQRRGASPLGLDLSVTLLRQARSLGLPLVRADMRRIPLADASVDVTLSMFTSFGYFDDDEEHRRLATDMGRVTRRFILLDVPNLRVLERDLIPASEREVDGLHVQERRWLERGPLRVCKSIEVVDPRRDPPAVERYQERVRLFDRDELTGFFASTPFTVGRLAGDYDGRDFDPQTSPRLLVRFERAERGAS